MDTICPARCSGGVVMGCPVDTAECQPGGGLLGVARGKWIAVFVLVELLDRLNRSFHGTIHRSLTTILPRTWLAPFLALACRPLSALGTFQAFGSWLRHALTALRPSLRYPLASFPALLRSLRTCLSL